jgi:cytochrome c556
MKPLAYVSAWLSLFALIGLSLAPAGAQDDAVPAVKKIMGKLNKGPKSLTATLKKDLNTDNLDWAKIQKDAKEFARLAGFMSKNEPPAGSKESWNKLTQQYAAYAKALNDAAQNMDQADAKKAHQKLSTACKSCHSEHRPKQ